MITYAWLCLDISKPASFGSNKFGVPVALFQVQPNAFGHRSPILTMQRCIRFFFPKAFAGVVSVVARFFLPHSIPWFVALLLNLTVLTWRAQMGQVPVRGYFAHALVDPSSCFQVAMKMRPLRSLVWIINGAAPKWLVYFMENPIKMDDLEVPPFQDTSIFFG